MPHLVSNAGLELWGGVECTLNRVGDRYLDQLERSGHHARVDDLERIAALGLRTLRFPLRWEELAPLPGMPIDWSRADARMARLRELGIRPIVGLVHHGSGPRHTSLLEHGFVTGLAELAARVAERYPWVDAYTPVNEPLTTARFSGLYGLWYPHGRSSETFLRCLVTECQAVAAAMRAVRRIRTDAKLVQTEDLGRVHGTPRLAYQVAYENERRWLSFDLLTGRVDREHPLYDELVRSGIGEDELARFVAEPCVPDLLGINHYITSDRFLDDDLSSYPAGSHGGNGRDAYADVEVVRARLDVPVDTASALREAWERYRLPLAVTEAHLAGPREEQMRWLAEVWRDACVLRDEGIDVRAVTAWSLLGAFDWNRLVTEEAGFYEPGAFDVRAPSPRPTGVARIIRRITAGERLDGEPVLAAPGWWRRPDRLFHALAQGRGFELEPTEPASESAPSRPILVCGGRGTLGAAFARLCDVRALSCHVVSRPELDITDRAALERLLDRVEPWAIVNAAGYVRVDRAEAEPEACFAANARGAALLADACARHGLRFLTFSSDLVFDGDKADPYLEGDPVAPRSVYGRSKVEAERQVLARHPEALVIRTAAFFGPWDEASFLARALSALRAGRPFAAASDLVVSPTYVVDLVHTSLDLLVDGEQGLLHLANSGALTWAELARRAAQLAGVSAGSLVPRPVAELRWPAPRPLRSALASERVWAMPALDDALERWVDERAKLGADREAA